MDFFEAKSFMELTHKCLPQLKQRGVYSKIATHLGVTNVYVTQVFKGDKHLSFEQALMLTDFFKLNGLQVQYLMHLVAMEKAGHHQLAEYHKKHLTKLREESKKIASRVKGQQQLSLEDQLTFYSDWKYTAFHLACAMPEVNSERDLELLFRLPENEVNHILDFLIQKGLVVREGKALSLGVTHTHLGKDSPLIAAHHRNWRAFAMDRSSSLGTDELMYSAPMVISRALGEDFRRALLELIQDFVKRTEGCPDEELRALNIDFLRIS
jgi:hypothetical protein